MDLKIFKQLAEDERDIRKIQYKYLLDQAILLVRENHLDPHGFVRLLRSDILRNQR